MLFTRSLQMHVGLLFHKRSFKVCCYLVLLYVLLTYLHYVFLFIGEDVSNMYSAATLYAGRYGVRYYGYFIRIYPLFIVFPSAFLFLTDRNSGICPLFQTRTGVAQYYWAKVAAGFIGGFFVIFIPFLIGLLLNIITFPLHSPAIIENWGTFTEEYNEFVRDYLFASLYVKHPYGYMVLLLFWFSAFSGILSSFLIAISFSIKKYKVFLLLPVYLIITASIILTNQFPFHTYLMFYVFACDLNTKSALYFLLLLTAFVMSTIHLTFRQIRKYDQLS